MPLIDSSVVLADTDRAWHALLAAAQLARHGAPHEETAFRIDSEGTLQPVQQREREVALRWHPTHGWTVETGVSPVLRDLAALYMPIIAANSERPLAVAHLGQSLDGYVATASGDSHYLNGRDNILHLHRMRALSDAVLVGAGTVAADNPRLTTRLVNGGNPHRVVLDPNGRLPSGSRVFVDGAAPTLVVRAADVPHTYPRRFGEADVMAVPARDGRFHLPTLVEALRARDLHVLFIEGGGATVSAFLNAGLLDRLQVTVAPLIIGAGRRGVRIPASAKLSDCLRPACRLHRMGDDALFDCDLHEAFNAAVVMEDGAPVSRTVSRALGLHSRNGPGQ